METPVKLVLMTYTYEVMDVFGRTHLDSAYDLAQYILSDNVVGPIVVKKIPVYRVAPKVNDEPAS